MKTSLNFLRTLAITLALSVGVAACTTTTPTPAPTELALAEPTPTATLSATSSLPPVTTTDAPVTPLPAPSPSPDAAGVFPWLPGGSPLAPTTLPDPTPDPTAAPTALPTSAPPTSAPPTRAPPTSAPPTAAPTPRPPTPAPTSTTGSQPVEVKAGDARPTRVVVKALGIDLAVVKGDANYPLCNVAQYMLGMANPGQPGTTYLYGHARTGMFLPLLTKSKINNGASMIGMEVNLYTADKKRHVYKINIVKRHATNFELAYNLRPGQHRLIMQTSEGPNGSYPKLQVAAKPVAVYASTAAEALPTARPRRCS